MLKKAPKKAKAQSSRLINRLSLCAPCLVIWSYSLKKILAKLAIEAKLMIC